VQRTLRTRRAVAVGDAHVADKRRQRGEAVAEDGAAWAATLTCV